VARDADDIIGRLAAAQAAQGLSASAEQIGAWEAQLARLREAVAANDGSGWTIALEYDLIRLGKRIDVRDTRLSSVTTLSTTARLRSMR
jgi:hypothetical protein